MIIESRRFNSVVFREMGMCVAPQVGELLHILVAIGPAQTSPHHKIK